MTVQMYAHETPNPPGMSRLLPALFLLLLTASFPAMSLPTQTEPIRQVIGPYGFPEHRVALADSLEIAYVDAGKGRVPSSSSMA